MKVDKETLICQKLIDMMETTSFFDIKVKDFVEFAGISRSTFYLYFDSLYDVLQKIEDDFLDGMFSESVTVQTVKTRQMEKPNAHFAIKVEYIERNKRLFSILLGPNGDPSFSARLVNRYKRIVTESWRGNQTIDQEHIELLSEYVAAGQIQALKWWVSREPEMDLSDVMLTMERYLLALYSATEQSQGLSKGA